MLCQRCGKRRASVSVTLNINGRAATAHLCDECAGACELPSFAPAADELWAMPPDADKNIRARRKINELHAQLKTAVQKENFEEAARIRDALSKIEDIKVGEHEHE